MNNQDKLMHDSDALIAEIRNESIRSFTSAMVHSVSMAWQRPASTRHHLLDEREPFGNLLHSVRVASLCKMIAEAVNVTFEVNGQGYHLEPSSLSNDILLSASRIHDLCRHGLFGTADVSVPNHPQLVREHANTHKLTCEYFDLIMTVVECHMGKWSQPTPVNLSIDACTALHLADSIVARWAEVMPSGSKENTND